MTYSVTINSVPSGASFYLGGFEYKGKTPLTLSGLDGNYDTKLSLSGYEDYEDLVLTPSMNGKTITVTLTAKSTTPSTPETPTPANVDIYQYVFVAPGPKFTDGDTAKFNYAEMSAAYIYLEDYPEGNEMLGSIAYFKGPLKNTSPIVVRNSFYDNDTNRLLGSLEVTVPTPESQGYDYWNWYKVKFWLGHANWEIYQPTTVRMEMNINGGGFNNVKKTLYQEVRSKTTPETAKSILTGRVVDSMLKSPIVNATVSWVGYSTKTDLNGYYKLLNPKPASAWVICDAVGYQHQEVPLTMPETGTKTVDIEMVKTPAPEQEKPWWQKMIEFIYNNRKFDFGISFDPLKYIYEEATGTELTETEWMQKQAKFLDWILPLNALSKLLTGKNLEGKAEEFGSAQDIIDVAFSLAWFVTPVKAATVGEKVLEKAGPEGLLEVGTKAVEKGASGTVLEGLMGTTWLKAIDIMKLNPLKYVSVFKELPEKEMIAVLQTLKKDTAGSLARDVFGKAFDDTLIAKAPLWKQAMFAAAKHKWKGFFGLVGLYGAAMGYDSWANWSVLDNLATTSGLEVDELVKAVKSGAITKEQAINEMNLQLRILEEGANKLKSSNWWNILQIIFWPLISDTYNTTVETIKLKLTELEAIQEVKKKGILKISPTPADAKIEVPGYPFFQPFTETEVDVGSYHVVVSKYGYISQEKDLEVKEKELTEWKVELKQEEKPTPLKAKLIIQVTPVDAKVLVSGHPEITKAGEYELDTGNYTVEFSLEGYNTERRTVYLNEGKSEVVSVALSKTSITPTPSPISETGTLNLVTIPSDANVEIAAYPNIKKAGTYVLNEGNYNIRVYKEGYEEQVKSVIIKANVTTTISVTLTPLPPSEQELATLTIRSEPTNADIYINGEYTYAKTPYTVKLEKGSYIIRAQMKDYYPYEAKVDLTPGQVGYITLPLTKMPPSEVPTTPYTPWETYYPEYQIPSTPYIDVQQTPYDNLPNPNYSLLDTQPISYEKSPEVTKPYVREIIVNVETTDVMPFAGRIYSIAWVDMLDPKQEAKVITSDDEEDVLKTFLDYFNANGFTKIVGFNVSFDHRYIFTKAALYRIPCPLWAKAEMRDVMQILQQVQEKYVYTLNKPGTLDDWGKHLLGAGKYGSQEEMLQRFVRKDFDYCDAFNIRQVEVTRDLYNLLRYTLGEAQISQLEAPQSTISSEAISEHPPEQTSQSMKICPNCMQANPPENEYCFVCGAKL